MAALVEPDDDEKYLLAILDSPDGLDLAEFAWSDPESPDFCYRAWDFQWSWYTNNDKYQVDQGGRALGKTVGIRMRAFAFPFYFEGQRMLLTAPELNHLRPLTDEVEKSLVNTRMMREMLPDGVNHGVARQPHWQAKFKNGAMLVSRLPNKDGKGVKGCVAAGTIILTRRGLVPIEDVMVGDEVWTHRQRWRPVQATYSYADAPAVTMRGAGHRGLTMSETHSMYARRNDAGPKKARDLAPPEWVTPACEAHEPDGINPWYFASPTTFDDLPGGGEYTTADSFWVAGHYLADGHVERGTLLAITDELEGLQPTLEALERLGLRYALYDHHGKAKSLRLLAGTEERLFTTWVVTNFGTGAIHKHIPTWLLGAEPHQRAALLNGYLAGDGHHDDTKNRWTISTASKPLAIGIKLLGQTFGSVCGYSWVDPQVTHIAGRALKSVPQRSHRVTLTASRRNAVHEDGLAWQKVRSIEPARDCTVHDLTVEEDHSYIADGLVSHNQHVINIELDEAQDYPLAGWIEVVETLNAGLPGAMWRCHGVPKGGRDRFYEKTQPNSGWTVHRPMAMNRPTWTDEERQAKLVEYGGSRQAIDYKRNIYGEHGDAANSVFVLARLMACVDTDEASTYNVDIYQAIKLEYEHFAQGASDDERLALIHQWVDLPGSHRTGWSQKSGRTEVGAPKGYSAYWAGMDVGVTNHPSEILVFGQRAGTDTLELLTRIQMHRINTDDQKHVITRLFEFYGDKLKFGIDKTGVGFPVWDQLTRMPYGERVHGFGFSEHRVVGYEDRTIEPGETKADLAIKRNMVEASTDWLRNDYVDGRRMLLPYDREVLTEFQGQTYTVVKDSGNPYGTKRLFGGGSFHTLDAAKVAVATKHIPPLEAMLDEKPRQAPVIDLFLGM